MLDRHIKRSQNIITRKYFSCILQLSNPLLDKGVNFVLALQLGEPLLKSKDVCLA